VALIAAGVALSDPWLPLEESGTVESARALGGGPGRVGLLYPLLLWAPTHLLSAGALLALAKVVSGLLWAAVALPAYALARRIVSPRTAVVVAGLVVVSAESVCGTVVLPDTLALLLATAAIAAAAVERPVAAVALAIAAAAARPWLAPLPLALAWALAPGAARRSLTRWPAAATLAVLPAAAYAAALLSGADSVSAVLRGALGSAALAAIAIGVVPVTLAWAEVASAPGRLLVPIVAAALAAGALAGPGTDIGADERASFFAAPLVLALAARALERRSRPSPRAVVASIIVLAAGVFALPWPLDAAAPGGLAAGAWRGLSTFLTILVVAAFAALPLLRLSPAVVAAASIALLLGTAAGAWSDVADRERALRRGVPLPRSQVDDTVGRSAFVTWAVTGSADPHAVAEAELWNRSLRRVVRADTPTLEADPTLVDGRHSEYALATIPLVGRPIARIPLGTIYRIDGEVRRRSGERGTR
jgi:hypothetical protein